MGSKPLCRVLFDRCLMTHCCTCLRRVCADTDPASVAAASKCSRCCAVIVCPQCQESTEHRRVHEAECESLKMLFAADAATAGIPCRLDEPAGISWYLRVGWAGLKDSTSLRLLLRLLWQWRWYDDQPSEHREFEAVLELESHEVRCLLETAAHSLCCSGRSPR